MRTPESVGEVLGKQRKVKNSAEAAFQSLAASKGWRVMKRGWPDFIVFDVNLSLVGLVEVKPHQLRRLSRPQQIVFEALKKFGVPCFFYSPDRGLLSAGDPSPQVAIYGPASH